MRDRKGGKKQKNIKRVEGNPDVWILIIRDGSVYISMYLYVSLCISMYLYASLCISMHARMCTDPVLAKFAQYFIIRRES